MKISCSTISIFPFFLNGQIKFLDSIEIETFSLNLTFDRCISLFKQVSIEIRFANKKDTFLAIFKYFNSHFIINFSFFSQWPD